MNTNGGKFLRIKKFLALVTAVGVLYASIVFSKNGFNFETNSNYIWIGWLLAFAATSAEFMLASDFRKLNWSIVALGLAAYAYSIWSNIVGFQDLRGKDTTDFFSISASIFMDVYPEVTIAWALGESKLGDVLGNLWRSVNTPEIVTGQESNGHTQPQRGEFQNGKYKAKHRPHFDSSRPPQNAPGTSPKNHNNNSRWNEE
jgi:hypothetical protein